jgi:hypothetical protein
MKLHRRRVAAGLCFTALALCVPATGAGASLANGPCANGDVPSQQGPTGGTGTNVCQGSGLVFVAPSVGQVATVIGPTIIGPATVGNAIVSAGDVAAG